MFSNLQWERAASNSRMLWSDADSYCASRTTGGWRLPEVQELQSLVDYTIDYKGPIAGINGTAFPDTPLNYFWSATSVVGSSGQAWYVSYGKNACYSGLVCSQANGWCGCVSSNVGYVRCVRGSIIPPVTNNRYDNTSISNVVKDLVTGLMWERKASTSTKRWQDAIAYCKGQVTGGFSGWRLPAVQELSTLLNYNITPGNLIMNQDVFAGEPVTWCWSSSVVSGSSSDAWYVGFLNGGVSSLVMSDYGRARCVYDSCPDGAITQADTAVSPPTVASQSVPALCWELGRKDSTTMNWNDAKNYCLQKGGDWRLPNKYELYVLHQQRTVLGSDFDVDYFWSSSQYRSSTILAWCVSGSGGFSWFLMSKHYGARCVRDV